MAKGKSFKTLFPFSLVFILCLWPLPATPAEAPWEETLKEVRFSPHLKTQKIAMVRFLPLPLKPWGRVPHERIFTGEFYSPKPTEAEFQGAFIPRNYLEIIDDNLEIIKRIYGLKLEVVESAGEIPTDADYVVFGAVRQFEASTQAGVSFDIQLLKGRTFSPLKAVTLDKQLTFKDVPNYANYPIHTIGNHTVDFQPQRDIVTLTSFLCLLDLMKFIDREARP